MEEQLVVNTKCRDCGVKLIVPTVTDCGLTFQTAPATCRCGWGQPGRWLKNGFVVDEPYGYKNLTNLDGMAEYDEI